MTVAMILEVPGATEAQYATVRRILGAVLHLGNLAPGAPPAAPDVAPFVEDAADGEPAWEDASWQ